LHLTDQPFAAFAEAATKGMRTANFALMATMFVTRRFESPDRITKPW
jgi:hypothetical protein